MKPIALRGLDFTKDDYIHSKKNDRILLVNIHVNGPKCNFKCPYCLVGDGTHLIDHTSQRKIASVVDQKKWIQEAQLLGSRTVIIDGLYEPLMNLPVVFEIIKYVNALGMVPILVTNGFLITKKIAARLSQANASVFAKINVPMVDQNDPRHIKFVDIQKFLTGVNNNDIYERLKKALHILINEGFTWVKQNHNGRLTTSLAVETVISPQNYDYICELVHQMRKLNIYVHAETIKPQGSAEYEDKFWIPPLKIKALFEEIKKDDDILGIDGYEISPPLAAGTCMRNKASFSITTEGDVIPCPSIEFVLGNLYHTTLEKIVKTNKDVGILRNLEFFLQGDCKKCELLTRGECYGGCRGYTYMALKKKGYRHKDAITASDPYCWRVKTVVDKPGPDSS